MKCKFCGNEWEAEGVFCPKCGGNNAEETVEEEAVSEEAVTEEAVTEKAVTEEAVTEEAVAEQPAIEEAAAEQPKKKGWVLGVAIACCAVLLAVVAALAWYLVNDGWVPKENDIHYKESYTVTDEQALRASDKVVATFAGEKLTNGQLQIEYWMQFYNFLEYYGSYLGYYIDLDHTKPLDQQMFEGSETTWQQTFLTMALDAWQRNIAMAKLAQKEGYVLSEESRSMLEELEASISETATANGYADATALVQADFGGGCDFEDYYSYMEQQYYGMEWYSAWIEALDPSKEDVEAYYDANAADFEASGIYKDSKPVVDVRHILIQPEGDGTVGEDGYPVYTEAAWEAARQEAFDLYFQWRDGEMTEESFAALAQEKSDDGSASVGGLYEDVFEGDMVEAFDEWIMMRVRKPGDHGVVKTQYGYHIMYFVDSTELWYYYALDEYLYDQGNQVLEAEIAEHDMKVNYKKIALAEVDFG